MSQKLRFKPSDPLNPQDTEKQTLGCRAFNPDICKNNCNDTCAFVREDSLCLTPPQRWDKKYRELLKGSKK